MLSERERWILYYDHALSPHPEGAPEMPMSGIMSLLYDRQQRGESFKLINNQSAAIRIRDMEIDAESQTACLLVTYADKDASDPVFSDLETGELRVEPKLEGEGVAISAHLLVSLVANGAGTYIALLEDVPGIGKTKLQPFLTSEFRNSSTYEFVDEEGRTRACRPRLLMDGHVAQTLREDLGRGSLLGIELVRHRRRDGENGGEFDREGFTEEVSRAIQIKPPRPIFGEDALGVVNWVKEKAQRAGYSDMKVRFKRNEGKQRSILVGTQREDAGDVLYSKCEKIITNTRLRQCAEQIVPEMANAMKTMMNVARRR